MLDRPFPSKSAALLLRPLFSAEATGNEAVRFGGNPQLPDDLAWPDGHYFVAQIDFAKLPRTTEMRGRSFALPDMPTSGTAFLFIRLFADDLYGNDGACVLYTPDEVGHLPERPAPYDLDDLRSSDLYHVDEVGLLSDGRTLVQQFADVLTVDTSPAMNPLWTNMLTTDEDDRGEERFDYDQHQDAVKTTLADSLAKAPIQMPVIAPRISEEFKRFNWHFKDRHLDWQFIFEWSKAFYLQCVDNALEHLAEFRKAGQQKTLTWILDKAVRRDRVKAEKVNFGSEWRPFGWTEDVPLGIDAPFDCQARAWICVSRSRFGPVPEDMLDAFLATLQEIVGHYERTDEEGYNLGPRNDALDKICKGHEWHAGHTLCDAQDAFKSALAHAVQRDEDVLVKMSPTARWEQHRADALIEEAKYSDSPNRFGMGAMPLQMFGHGFEVQNAVRENADMVLLLQLGDPSSGIPVKCCDGLLQLWIDPDDLAHGEFDSIITTLDCT